MSFGNHSSFRFIKHRHNPFLIEEKPHQSISNQPNPTQFNPKQSVLNRYNPNQANPSLNSNPNLNGFTNLLKFFAPNSGLINVLQGFLKGQETTVPDLRNMGNSVSRPERIVQKGESTDALNTAKNYYLKNVINNGQVEEGQHDIPATPSASVKELKDEIKKLKEENRELQQQLDRIKGIMNR